MVGCVQQISFWYSPAGGATIALVGVAVTGLITWWLSGRTRRWQLADDRRNRLLQRGEEAYSLVRNWYLDRHHWYIHHRLVMDGRVDYNSALDAVIEHGGKRSFQSERIDLILDVYFLDISPIWKTAVSAYREASGVENDFRNAYKEGMLSSDWHKAAYDDAWKDTHLNVEKTLDEISLAIKKTARP